VSSEQIVIIDYGGGNTGSVAKALTRLGAKFEVTSDAAVLAQAERAILPGVGNFGAMMEGLDRRGLRAPLAAYLAAGDRPFLGICVGLQALLEGSDEAPGIAGLGAWPGRVRRFAVSTLKVPHVGWSRLQCLRPSRLLAGLGSQPAFYFTHSYYAPVDGATTYCVAYGDEACAAVAEQGNIFATQFHPEKSGTAGLAALTNFLTLPRVAPVLTRNPAPQWNAPAHRIIPCLDVRDGRVVKGVQFLNLRDNGDPAELARAYNLGGADELMLLDITASHEARPILIDTVRRTARELFIPFSVGGGVRSVSDAAALLAAGADKVSVNTAAVERPELISDLARELGSQAVILAIDAKRSQPAQPAQPERWEVLVKGGRVPTGRDAVAWAREGEQRGAGEILLTSMDRDGVQSGFDCALTSAVSRAVSIPVIASGGAGSPQDFVDVFTRGHADAALAASIFHTGAISIADLKSSLSAAGVHVRPVPSGGSLETPRAERASPAPNRSLPSSDQRERPSEKWRAT
jgi:glutamine amidotransferase/cyclase